MSTEQKEKFDNIFKIFIGIAITFFGWLGARTADRFDRLEENIEQIRITNQGMKTDIDWIMRDRVRVKKDTEDNRN